MRKNRTFQLEKFGLFIQHLETLSCDTSVKSSDQSKLKGFLRKWKSGKLFDYSCFFVDLLQPAAVLSQMFQAEDVDAVAMSTVRKQLDSLQEKEVHKLQTVKHSLDKVENEEDQGVKISGFANAIKDFLNLKSKDANCYIQLLNDAIEARLGGSSDIASIASILNSVKHGISAAVVMSPWMKSFCIM